MYRLRLWIFLSLSFTSVSAQPESWYINQLAEKLNAQTEVQVENGRVDLVSDEYAIEVERATNWKHSIGQSLWYALQTNKKPGIILLMASVDERKNGIRLQSALDYAGLGDKVKVWFYPEDFGETYDEVQSEFNQQKQSPAKETGYWLTTSSDVRHNYRCKWYTVSKGRYCTAIEGKPCGICRG
jgi:hypothetical protein